MALVPACRNSALPARNLVWSLGGRTRSRCAIPLRGWISGFRTDFEFRAG